MKKKLQDNIIAIQKWKEILGAENVVDNIDYSTTTFEVSHQVIAALLPSSSSQICDCLQVANKYKIPVYPVSGGKNFGLGSKVPVIDQSVVIDLKLMNKISDFNEEMAYVTVEPGVTFKQLEEYLINKGGKLMMDSIGSTPYASIIGNTVERGHGMGLYADRFDNICSLKVILPTGEMINTGFNRYKKNKVGKLSKWGLGPAIDGLFTQSNLGIVTELTFWLKPKPKHFQSFIIHMVNDEEMSEVVNRFRKMRLEGLQVSLRIFNDYRMVAFSNQYYNIESLKGESFSRQKINEIKPSTTGKWIAIGGLYSFSELHAKAEKEYIIDSLKDLNLSITIWDKLTVDSIVEKNPEKKEEMDFFYYKSSLAGYTSDKALNMCYWRLPNSIPDNKDIHKDQCGLLWYCPTIPCIGEDAIHANSIIEKISYKYNLEPNVGFLFIAERTLDITGAICFDKKNKEEMNRAKKCHDEIMEELIKAGYPPYRLGIQSMNLFAHTEEKSLYILDEIKKSLDPNNIMANKRYSRL